jgi:hypothetical protein
MRRNGSLGIALAAGALLLSGCALAGREGRAADRSCDFVVHNQTADALEIRLLVRGSTFTPIGVLNPGELLTYSVPCAEKRIWIRGGGLPVQAGAFARTPPLTAWTDLVEGERVIVALHWP